MWLSHASKSQSNGGSLSNWTLVECMEDIEIKSSFIDWLPTIENGKTAVIALTLNGVKSYETVYWTDGQNETISIDPEFLVIFSVNYEEELPFYHDLLDDIRTTLPGS